MWPVVLWGSLGCFALKLLGYLVPQRLLDSPPVVRVTHLIPVAMLAALVVVQTLGSENGLVLDARAAGVAVAVVALALRAPFLVVVVLAGAVAAGLRYTGWAV